MTQRHIRQGARHKQGATRGFTLVEMLTALTIISLVFLAFCDLMVMSVRTNKKADYEFVATGVAEQKLQATRQLSYGALITGTTTEAVTTLPGGQMTTEITSVPGFVTNSMRQVQILVTWTSIGGQATTGGRVQLDTLLAQSR